MESVKAALRVYKQILSRHARGVDGPGKRYGLKPHSQ